MTKHNFGARKPAPAPARSPARRLVRGLLTLIGVIVILAVPAVACWRTIESHEPPVGEVAGDPLDLADRRSLEDRLLAAYLQLQGEEALKQPASEDPTVVPFTIHPGETAAEIAARLEKEGLIRDANLFRVLLRIRGVDTQLEAGDYQLRRNMNMEEIMSTLQHGRPPTVSVTIPEGWRMEQIAALLAANGLVDSEEFLQLARDGGGFEYDFLADRPAGIPSLEGYLFPDTYEFSTSVTAREVIQRMLETFGERFTPEMRQQAQAHGLTIYEAVTLASIVEREAQIPAERPLIAGVFYNRLKDGMHLNADPTIQYALGYQEDTGQWWKRPLWLEDLQFDSPYNTYLYVGLPPGPICNPGLASLEAAVNPAETSYYYFVANDVAGDGSHVFAETLEEHKANIEKYRQ